MVKNKKLHIKLNWYTVITISISIVSIIILLFTLFSNIIYRDINIGLAYVAYFYNIQIIILAATVVTCIYQLFSTKRIININKKNHLKIYLYRFLFFIVSIILSLILSAILLQHVNTESFSGMHNAECMGTECLGEVAAGAMVFISFLIAVFSTLVVNVVYLFSCFLADIVYCYKINNTNTNSEAVLKSKTTK